MKPTQCTAPDFAFQALGSRQVVTQFSGYRVTSDAGGLLLREVEAATGIVRRGRPRRCVQWLPRTSRVCALGGRRR